VRKIGPSTETMQSCAKDAPECFARSCVVDVKVYAMFFAAAFRKRGLMVALERGEHGKLQTEMKVSQGAGSKASLALVGCLVQRTSRRVASNGSHLSACSSHPFISMRRVESGSVAFGLRHRSKRAASGHVSRVKRLVLKKHFSEAKPRYNPKPPRATRGNAGFVDSTRLPGRCVAVRCRQTSTRLALLRVLCCLPSCSTSSPALLCVRPIKSVPYGARKCCGTHVACRPWLACCVTIEIVAR